MKLLKKEYVEGGSSAPIIDRVIFYLIKDNLLYNLVLNKTSCGRLDSENFLEDHTTLKVEYSYSLSESDVLSPNKGTRLLLTKKTTIDEVKEIITTLKDNDFSLLESTINLATLSKVKI